MKFCILIPCYNHSTTVADVARAAAVLAPVLVVDDGSTEPLPDFPRAGILRLQFNQGKAAALRAGFNWAAQEGFTHVITMDADGQHVASDVPRFIAAAQANPQSLIVGVRDLVAAGAPPGRRRSNKVSNFWFRVETGVRLPDTQCGFRCYPIPITQSIRTRSGRYEFELEFMVRASWTGVSLTPVPVVSSYRPEQLRSSHFRPVADLARITFMNIGLVLQSWVVPQPVRAAWSRGERPGLRKTIADFFADHAERPAQLAGAVGLGLFCGIAPIWGYQMVAAALLAHWLRLNKAIALVASNISIPPLAPFILYAGLALGHWLFTGRPLEFSLTDFTRSRALEYTGQWLVGSVVLGVLIAVAGTVITYATARICKGRFNSADPR